MPIFAAIVLTILPGSWIIYGLRLSGIPSLAKLALAIALSPSVVGLQLVVLEAIGAPYAVAAIVLLLLNLPGALLLVRHYRMERVTCDVRGWLWSLPLVTLLVGLPVLIWALIPGSREYSWNAMIHTDIVYAIARDGVPVEETNLAGLSLAYGWIGHGYWSLICWIGDWPPTAVYPFTNVLWIIVAFILSYHIGRSGLGLHRTTSLLGVGMMFLGTNVAGMVVRIVMGYSQWWASYLGDIRYTPFLGKYHGFESMPWGMALLVAMALVYTIALRRRVTPLDGLTVALLVGLGLVYPVLFPAGLVLAGCFLLLAIARWTKDLPQYTRWDIARLGLAIVMSVVAVWFYLGLITADRGAGTFALSRLGSMRNKSIRALGALGPFAVMAALPFIGFIRRRHGPALLLALSALALSAVYIGIELGQLEYKYVLAATICVAFLAAAVVDPAFRRHPRLGSVIGTAVPFGLAVINLWLVFQTSGSGYVPLNASDAPQLDEGSFWLALSPTEQDSTWTRAIREYTPENTLVIARRPGIQLSPLVGRSMFFPSAIEGGHVPGYNLDHRKHLVGQRGYPAEVYERRLGVVETLYTSEDEIEIIEALHDLKALRRPVAIHFVSPDTFSLRWLESQAAGRELVSDDENIVWLVEDPGTLP